MNFDADFHKFKLRPSGFYGLTGHGTRNHRAQNDYSQPSIAMNTFVHLMRTRRGFYITRNPFGFRIIAARINRNMGTYPYLYQAVHRYNQLNNMFYGL